MNQSQLKTFFANLRFAHAWQAQSIHLATKIVFVHHMQRRSVADFFKRANETLGRIDITVGNAGIINEHEWEKCIDINLVSVHTSHGVVHVSIST